MPCPTLALACSALSARKLMFLGPNCKPHSQQVEKKPQEASPQSMPWGVGWDRAPQGHCWTHHDPAAMALYPWLHTSVMLTQPCPSWKLHEEMLRLSCRAFGLTVSPCLQPCCSSGPGRPEGAHRDLCSMPACHGRGQNGSKLVHLIDSFLSFPCTYHLGQDGSRLCFW